MSFLQAKAFEWLLPCRRISDVLLSGNVSDVESAIDAAEIVDDVGHEIIDVGAMRVLAFDPMLAVHVVGA